MPQPKLKNSQMIYFKLPTGHARYQEVIDLLTARQKEVLPNNELSIGLDNDGDEAIVKLGGYNRNWGIAHKWLKPFVIKKEDVDTLMNTDPKWIKVVE